MKLLLSAGALMATDKEIMAEGGDAAPRQLHHFLMRLLEVTGTWELCFTP